MGTLYIDRKDLHVKLDGNALCFYANGTREGMAPIKPLKRVVVVGNVTLEASVLHRLSDEGISVLFLSGKSNRFCGSLNGRLHNNGLLRVRQYEKSLALPFTFDFSQEMVSRKIKAQLELLRYALDERPDLRLALTTAIRVLEKIEQDIDLAPSVIDTVMGFEGGAASSYFQAYIELFPPSLSFRKRNRRPPQDPVNAMLSLCYTMLHYELVREIEVIGLDPTIGFYHQFEYGRESLACDLIEPYRSVVDRFVWDIFRKREFTDRDFATEDDRPGCYLKKGGRQRFYPIYEEWARGMRPAWVEEVRTLARRITGEKPLPA